MEEVIPYVADYKWRPEKLKKAETPSHYLSLPLDCVNWGNDYPTKVKAEVRLWHTKDALYIKYHVDEKEISALVDQDNGKVSKDSCVEAFISFDDSGYYNIEANCIGRVLMSHRKGRKENVCYADQGVLQQIEREPSLGEEVIKLTNIKEPWELILRIPVGVFFKNQIRDLSGLKCKANFYKCGDSLPGPHFLSWKPISTPNPDFHRPEYFSSLSFE